MEPISPHADRKIAVEPSVDRNGGGSATQPDVIQDSADAASQRDKGAIAIQADEYAILLWTNPPTLVRVCTSVRRRLNMAT